MTPPVQRQPAVLGEPGPLSGRAAQVRLEISDRRQGLAEYDEVGALDWTARILAALHDEVWGRIPTVAADRTPRRRRKQLAGEAALPLEDLMYLVLYDPTARGVLLRLLTAALGYEPPVPVSRISSSPAAELADVVESFSATASEFTRATEDGRLSPSEISRLEELAGRLLREVVDFQAAIREVER